MNKLTSLLFILTLSLGLFGLKASEEELEKLPLIALLLKNGHTDRAQLVFNDLTPKEKQKDLKRVHTLEGLLHLSSQKFDLARLSFLKARELGQNDPELFIYMAQAYFGLEDYQSVINELTGSKEKEQILVERPRVSLLLAEAWWKRGEYKQSLEFLEKLMAIHPELSLPKLTYVQSLLDLELIQYTYEWAMTSPRQEAWSERDLLTMASLFQAKSASLQVIKLLEFASLRYSTNPEIKFQLASVYAQQNKFLAAATVLENQSKRYPLELSELYRQSGFAVRADYLAGLVDPIKDRTQQKLTLYLAKSEFDRAITLEKDLEGLGLLDSDQLRYALAYAFYKVRDFKKSEFHLAKINEPSVYEKALLLRSSLGRCEENIWSCE